MLRWDHTLKRGRLSSGQEANPPKYLTWEPSQATLDKDMKGLVLLASAGHRVFANPLKSLHSKSIVALAGPLRGNECQLFGQHGASQS